MKRRVRPLSCDESNNDKSSTSKKKKASKAFSNEEMKRTMAALESSEGTRMDLAQKLDEHEGGKFFIETQRMEMDQQTVIDRLEFERQLLVLEEKRLQQEAERAKDAATERRISMEIQSMMLSML